MWWVHSKSVESLSDLINKQIAKPLRSLTINSINLLQTLSAFAVSCSFYSYFSFLLSFYIQQKVSHSMDQHYIKNKLSQLLSALYHHNWFIFCRKWGANSSYRIQLERSVIHAAAFVVWRLFFKRMPKAVFCLGTWRNVALWIRHQTFWSSHHTSPHGLDFNLRSDSCNIVQSRPNKTLCNTLNQTLSVAFISCRKKAAPVNRSRKNIFFSIKMPDETFQNHFTGCTELIQLPL